MDTVLDVILRMVVAGVVVVGVSGCIVVGSVLISTLKLNDFSVLVPELLHLLVPS